MVETYYNSRQFTCTLALLEKWYPSPWDMFLALAAYYKENGLAGVNHSRMARYDILWGLISETGTRAAGEGGKNQEASESRPGREDLRDALVRDFYLRENAKTRPAFARDLRPCRDRIREFYRREEMERRHLPSYGSYDARQMERMTHMEVWGDGSMTLFDYRDRDPQDGNAREIICGQQFGRQEI